MPWKVTDTMSQRLEFCILATDPDANISLLCRHFGISRQTGYKWLKRRLNEGDSGVADRSRQPNNSPFKTPVPIEGRVITKKLENPCWGPRKLHRLLRGELPSAQLPSRSTVARILKRNGFVSPRKGSDSHPAEGRFERSYCNDLWQMDLKGPMRLQDGLKVYSVAVLDDNSRYLLCLKMIPDATDAKTLSCWIEAAREHGLPNETLTDHGSQFRLDDVYSSSFRVYLWACGVQHTQGKVCHPQTQGKVERFWRTFNEEVLRRHSYSDISSWQFCFDDWREVYNKIRPHQALGDEPPSSRYYPSDRSYHEPDRHLRIGLPGSQYRRVNERGQIVLGGKRISVGRGFLGWTVEARPLGTGCWHIYFRHRFIREFMLTPSLGQNVELF